MAKEGQLKAKIDLLKKKIAEKAGALPLERRRFLTKRLRRLQRTRRRAAAAEKKQQAEKPRAKGAAAAPEGAAPQA